MGEQAGPRTVLWKGMSGPALAGRGAVDRREGHGHKRLLGGEQVAIVPFSAQQMIDDGSQGLLAGVGEGRRRYRGIHRGIFSQAIEVIKGQHVIEERAHTHFQSRAGKHARHRLL